MITAAAVSRIGAIEILQSRPPVGEEARHENPFRSLHRPLRWAFNQRSVCARRHGIHGMGSSHMSMMGMSMTGGALGTTAAAPGTNSSGTALSSGGMGRP